MGIFFSPQTSQSYMTARDQSLHYVRVHAHYLMKTASTDCSLKFSDNKTSGFALQNDLTLQKKHHNVLMSSFPGQPGELVPECQTILDFAEAKDDGGGIDDNSFNTCKTPAKSPTLTYQHSSF